MPCLSAYGRSKPCAWQRERLFEQPGAVCCGGARTSGRRCQRNTAVWRSDRTKFSGAARPCRHTARGDLHHECPVVQPTRRGRQKRDADKTRDLQLCRSSAPDHRHCPTTFCCCARQYGAAGIEVDRTALRLPCQRRWTVSGMVWASAGSALPSRSARPLISPHCNAASRFSASGPVYHRCSRAIRSKALGRFRSFQAEMTASTFRSSGSVESISRS